MQRFFLLLWALILPLQSFAIMRTDAFQENDIPDNLWVCSVFQNEGPYLREWIEYHRMIGAEHFILFNNNSDDDYLNILDPYIQDKVVTLVEWPTPRHQASYNQTGAIRQALNMSRGKTRWLASIDIDEFIVPMYTENLVDFLRSYEDYGQVILHWYAYGTSYVPKIPDDKLMIEVLRRRLGGNRVLQTKVILKPHRTKLVGVHESVSFPPFKAHDFWPSDEHPPLIRINHYWMRDEDFLLNVKRPRRERWEGKAWDEKTVNAYLNMYNDYEDDTMERFVPELRKRMFGDDA